MSHTGLGNVGVPRRFRPLQRRTDAASWRPVTFVVSLLLALGLTASPSVAAAAGRVALVVGNSTYAAIGELPNPGNDAADVGAALGRLGFVVTTVRDADRAGLTEALRAFTRESVGADVALVFYAGHGLEMDGVNYLVPVDAQLEQDTDVRYETVSLDDVLAAVEGAALRVVILDACRNNPLARSMTRTIATRSVSRGSFGELNEDLLGDETLVAYAAAAGTTAADGTGRNSPYTAALLGYLEEPLELSALFRRVRGQVLKATDGRQRPHEYGSLLSEHFLGGASGPAPVAVADAAPSAALVQQETVFWQSIADSEELADFEAYLRQFPTGVYAGLARNRVASLRASASDPPSAPSVSRPPVVGVIPQVAQELAALLGRELSASRSDENGWTDLHYAAALNLPDLVIHLLDDGASSSDRLKWPLRVIRRLGEGDIVNARIKRDGAPLSDRLKRTFRELGHDFDGWTRDGETPLHVAASVGAHDAALELIANGADLDARTPLDWTPLHYATWTNAHDVVETLLASGADVEATVVGDWTPLHLAVWADNREAVEALLARGADVTAETRDGETSLELSKSEEMSALLRSNTGR